MVIISIFNGESKVNQPPVGFCFTKMLILPSAVPSALMSDLMYQSFLLNSINRELDDSYNLEYDKLDHYRVCAASSSESATCPGAERTRRA
jgi:hypothetical protein